MNSRLKVLAKGLRCSILSKIMVIGPLTSVVALT